MTGAVVIAAIFFALTIAGIAVLAVVGGWRGERNGWKEWRHRW